MTWDDVLAGGVTLVLLALAYVFLGMLTPW